MEGYRNILIVGEWLGNRLSPLSTQLMRIGKRLSKDLGQEMQLLVLGGKLQRGIEQAYCYGADRVYMATSPLLEHYITDSYLLAMEQVINGLNPAIVLFGHNDKGLDLAPRLAFRFKTGVTLDCMDLKIDEEKGLLEQVKPVFGGKAHARYCSTGLPKVASVREGAFDPADRDESRKGEVVELPISLDPSRIRTRLVERVVDKELAMQQKLASSHTVVSGGRGLKKKEGVDLIRETAGLLDGAIGGSRPAVDNGWLPSSLQVGLTGKKVNPRLYIAVGISGTLQHMAGCSKSKTIVAINSDESAPIFRFSHFGAVGDYEGILRGFNEEVKIIKHNRLPQSNQPAA